MLNQTVSHAMSAEFCWFHLFYQLRLGLAWWLGQSRGFILSSARRKNWRSCTHDWHTISSVLNTFMWGSCFQSHSVINVSNFQALLHVHFPSNFHFLQKKTKHISETIMQKPTESNKERPRKEAFLPKKAFTKSTNSKIHYRNLLLFQKECHNPTNPKNTTQNLLLLKKKGVHKSSNPKSTTRNLLLLKKKGVRKSTFKKSLPTFAPPKTFTNQQIQKHTTRNLLLLKKKAFANQQIQ